MCFGFFGAEPCRIIWKYLNNLVLDPKRAKLNQNSSFGHVRTYSWLHKLRNTQGNRYGSNLRNIYIHIYIYILNMSHIFSLVCFLIYGVKSRSGHDRSQSFGSILHVSGAKLSFWCISRWFSTVLHRGVQQTLFLIQKRDIWLNNGPKPKKYVTNIFLRGLRNLV